MTPYQQKECERLAERFESLATDQPPLWHVLCVGTNPELGRMVYGLGTPEEVGGSSFFSPYIDEIDNALLGKPGKVTNPVCRNGTFVRSDSGETLSGRSIFLTGSPPFEEFDRFISLVGQAKRVTALSSPGVDAFFDAFMDFDQKSDFGDATVVHRWVSALQIWAQRSETPLASRSVKASASGGPMTEARADGTTAPLMMGGKAGEAPQQMTMPYSIYFGCVKRKVTRPVKQVREAEEIWALVSDAQVFEVEEDTCTLCASALRWASTKPLAPANTNAGTNSNRKAKKKASNRVSDADAVTNFEIYDDWLERRERSMSAEEFCKLHGIGMAKRRAIYEWCKKNPDRRPN